VDKKVLFGAEYKRVTVLFFFPGENTDEFVVSVYQLNDVKTTRPFGHPYSLMHGRKKLEYNA